MMRPECEKEKEKEISKGLVHATPSDGPHRKFEKVSTVMHPAVTPERFLTAFSLIIERVL
jgi:hypothetical protein